MIRPPISAEARGRVRALTAELQLPAARMAAGLARLPAKTLNPWEWKGRVGAERAVAKIRRALPVAPELATPVKAVWRWVEPVAELPTDDDPPQAGFVIMGVVIAGNKNREVRIETFGMAATEHAVARLLDRSGFRADPVATMLEAHAALTEVDQDNGQRMFDLKNAQLPTATGAFLATPGRFGPDAAPLMVCRTWLPADQLFEDQAGTREAWRILLSHPTLP